MAPTIAELTATLPQIGRLERIGLRPARGVPMVSVDAAEVEMKGIVGDRAKSDKRAVTLIQAEHLPVISALAGLETPLDAGRFRRNLVVSGINLLALKGRRFRIGDVELAVTAPCHPCSKMEALLGPGGWNAMRGHGGQCARVLKPGIIRVGDPVQALSFDG